MSPRDGCQSPQVPATPVALGTTSTLLRWGSDAPGIPATSEPISRVHCLTQRQRTLERGFGSCWAVSIHSPQNMALGPPGSQSQIPPWLAGCSRSPADPGPLSAAAVTLLMLCLPGMPFPAHYYCLSPMILSEGPVHDCGSHSPIRCHHGSSVLLSH